MPQFEVVIRVLGVGEADPITARQSVEEQLRAGGIQRWQIVQVVPQGNGANRNNGIITPPRPVPRAQPKFAGGTLVVAAAVAWAAWFLWVLAG